MVKSKSGANFAQGSIQISPIVNITCMHSKVKVMGQTVQQGEW